tara:strand:- start:425 stop:1297 length:873 start_codon:yes stop_codon:yes gene_type:complete
MNFSKSAVFSLYIFFYILLSTSHAAEVIRYPKEDALFPKHHQYPIELLKLALSYQSNTIHIAPSDFLMTQGRAIRQLAAAKDIDVMWTMTSKQRESEIRAIRIPIYKGLIGWRIFLSTEEWLLDKGGKKLDLESLKKATIIQGHDWPDTEILKYNNFNVLEGSDYAGLFQVLSFNRAELFPRSIIEIWNELDSYASSNIRLELNTLISYPTASYFFVSPNNEALAKIIKNGLISAHKDGSFELLFNKYYLELINKSELNSRQHYRLVNPLLPKKTPLDKKLYWFHLNKVN